MSTRHIVLKLNQQQIELIDKTVANGEAADRAALARRALKEYAAKHPPAARQLADTERKP